jgi:hypothetical protein
MATSLFTNDTGFKACRFTDNALLHSLLFTLSSLKGPDHPILEGNQTCWRLGIVVPGLRDLGTSWVGIAVKEEQLHHVLRFAVATIIATIASKHTSTAA